MRSLRRSSIAANAAAEELVKFSAFARSLTNNDGNNNNDHNSNGAAFLLLARANKGRRVSEHTGSALRPNPKGYEKQEGGGRREEEGGRRGSAEKGA